MKSLFLIFCLVFCLLVVHANGEKVPEPGPEGSADWKDGTPAESKDPSEDAEEKEEESEEGPLKEDTDEDSDENADGDDERPVPAEGLPKKSPETGTEGSADWKDGTPAESKDPSEDAEEKEEESKEGPLNADDDKPADVPDNKGPQPADIPDNKGPQPADMPAMPKEFVCNLKYKRIGCYADKGAKDKPLASFLMSDQDMGTTTKKGKLPKSDTFNGELPKFACKCANEALTTGNAIFGLQNVAECWSGPDDSKYDKDGPSENCITFDYANCAAESEVCAGKKGANFMYYIDTPDHTKTQDEINTELAEDKKKQEKEDKKKENGAKKAKKGKKKAKKSKAKH